MFKIRVGGFRRALTLNFCILMPTFRPSLAFTITKCLKINLNSAAQPSQDCKGAWDSAHIEHLLTPIQNTWVVHTYMYMYTSMAMQCNNFLLRYNATINYRLLADTQRGAYSLWLVLGMSAMALSMARSPASHSPRSAYDWKRTP